MAKRQGEGLKHKLKTLLGLKKTNTVPTIGIDYEEEQIYIFTVDKLKELNRENHVNHRARVLKELCETVASRKLEEHAAEAVWNEISDMLQAATPTEPRQSALRFLVCLAAGQAHALGILRAQFLRLIDNHDVKDDMSYRIDLLIALTDNGKDLSYCEDIGPFLLRFTTEVLEGDRTEEFLMFLINLVHYNSSFLGKEIITGLVERACAFCNKAKVEKEIETCLQLLDATVRYGGLPSDGLLPLIATLCRTVNIERFCQASWKLMKTLVGTRLGHSAIYIMCCILEDEENLTDSILLRGAVFFIGMCIWGSKRVTSLQHKPISLLPSFKQALHCSHPIVAHEIGLSLQRLVKKYGKDLQIVTWDIILDLVDMLIKSQQNFQSGNESLKKTVHDLLSTIEDLYNAGKFDGSAERFFAIIERCSSHRPDSSVLTLLSFLHEGIHPAKDGWLDVLRNVMENYFRKETRTEIRVKVLDILSAVLTSYRFWYEEELLELAVLSYLGDIDKEQDPNVRLVAAQLLVDLISTFTSNKCLDLLAILKKLVNRLMDPSGSAKRENDDQLVTDGEHLRDITIAVNGLIDAFKQKLVESPTVVAIRILEILVEHVSFHYINGFTARTGADARIEIFRMFLNIRADERHRIGVIRSEDDSEGVEIRYSVFATCKPVKIRDQSHTANVPIGRKLSLTKYCCTSRTFEAVLNCLKDEWEWSVLQFVLLHLPDQLRNKTLILGGGSDVANLCVSLCCMVNDSQFLNKVKNVPPGSGRTELLNLVFPILAVLVTYHDSIEKTRQIELVKSLEIGLNSQCARLCVICLTICILEMKSVMLRTLPSILIKLSKISATVPMSIPMLEFLSSLKEITELYSNFVEEQYMSIFAIALPYTDAHRYSQYTVTLAHYVIASWFTRCRLSFRKGFVRLITKGLQSSAITRLTERQSVNSNASKTVEETHEFHKDMTEVCSDMMAKYSFSTISNQPKRSSVTQFLLSTGLSQSWLVGNTLVTVTTSGSTASDCAVCAQKKAKQTASRAAVKLRYLNINAEKMMAGGNSLPLSRAIEASDAKLNAREDSCDAQSKPDAGARQKETVKFHAKDDVAPGAEPRGEATGRADSLLIRGVAVNKATENLEMRKDSRVDSAVEMTEDSEPNEVIAEVVEDRQTALITSNQEADDQELEKSGNDEEVSDNVCRAEKAKEKSQEISLVDRLALEDHDVGHMFSPTHYFLSEMSSVAETGISATSSMEFDKDEGESKSVVLMKEKKEDSGDSTLVDANIGIKEEGNGKIRLVVNVSGEVRQELTASIVNTGSNIGGDEDMSDVQTDLDSTVRDVSDATLRDFDLKDSPANSSSDRIDVSSSNEEKLVLAPEPMKMSPEKEEHDSGEYFGYVKQSFLRTQPTSVATSRDSSAQASPLASKKTSLQTSIELSSEYEMVEEEDARSFDVKSNIDRKAAIDGICLCSSECWAEIMIRRPTGNTSWVMRMENALDPEGRDFGGVEDIASFAAAMEAENFSFDLQELSDAKPDDKMLSRLRTLSTVTDELSRERQSNRSSSDSPKLFSNEACSDSPNAIRRRRFSTGSMDIPGVFKFSLPSPDQSKDKDEVSDGSFSTKYYFEKPSLGFSPLSSLKRSGSTSSLSDLKDKTQISINDLASSSNSRSGVQSKMGVSPMIPGNPTAFDMCRDSSLDDGSKIMQQGKSKLAKTMSGPTKSGPTASDMTNSSSMKSGAMQPDSHLTHSQRSSSLHPYSGLAESISKDYELHQRRTEGTEKGSKDVPPSKIRTVKSVTGSLRKDDHRATKDSYNESQLGMAKKSSAKAEDQRTAAQQAMNVQSKDTVRVEIQKSTAQNSKATSRKEPLKAGAQAIKDKISSFSAYRPRGKTVSAYPVSKLPPNRNEDRGSMPDKTLNAPLNPFFVFLQFFYSPFISAGGSARPLLLSSGEVIDRAVKMLDRIPPYNYHKIGLIYVGPGQQSHETSILANQYGSSRYVRFLRNIGTLISLLDCSQTEIYTGGLDCHGGTDGKFAYFWKDSITQVIFHVATLMPCKPSDPACTSKKLHIGNNFVTIVYNDSSKPYQFGTIKGQFNFAEVVIRPLDYNSNLVTVRMKEDLGNVVTNTGPHVISDDNLPILVRQLAVHTNMATVLHYSKSKPSDAYGCNWLERLKQIKRIRSKAVIESQGPVTSSSLMAPKGGSAKQMELANSDFTDYT